jgi:hypothetical protein
VRHVREQPEGRRRVVDVDVVGDPEPALAAQKLRAAVRIERRERAVVELIRGGVGERDDRPQPLLAPFPPVALSLSIRDPVAVRDEPAAGELARPRLLGLDRGLRPTANRLEVLVEIGPKPFREALDEPSRLVALEVLLEALLGSSNARPDVDPGNARVPPLAGLALELDDVDVAAQSG